MYYIYMYYIYIYICMPQASTSSVPIFDLPTLQSGPGRKEIHRLKRVGLRFHLTCTRKNLEIKHLRGLVIYPNPGSLSIYIYVCICMYV